MARCLDCVKEIVDEIIIVDTGSTDKTKEIAYRYTDKVYDFEWIDNFSAARNFSFSKAASQYILWLDADDMVTPQDAKNLQVLKTDLDTSVNIVMMKYDVNFDEFDRVTMSYCRERLIKNSPQNNWQDAVHEVITPSGNVIYSDIAIQHRKPLKTENEASAQRNLNIYRRQKREGKVFSPRQKFYYARELMFFGYLDEAVKEFEEFIANNNGWIENNIEACKNLSACYCSLGLFDKSFLALTKSFSYDVPRAEICCELGRYFFLQSNYELAIYWYLQATKCELKANKGGFCLNDCYRYIPHIQLCVCYDRIGEKEKAIFHNNKAGEVKPDDESVNFNKQYFESNINN